MPKADWRDTPPEAILCHMEDGIQDIQIRKTDTVQLHRQTALARGESDLSDLHV